MSLSRPALHALINGSAAVALAIGFFAIRNAFSSAPVEGDSSRNSGHPARMRWLTLHRLAMMTAFALSTIFLVSYLDYHARVGTTRFHGTPTIRLVYLTVLASHTVLAVGVVPLVLTTVGLALRGKFDRHRRWARWTWPIWMYVCVTGVGIYFFLKHGQS